MVFIKVVNFVVSWNSVKGHKSWYVESSKKDFIALEVIRSHWEGRAPKAVEKVSKTFCSHLLAVEKNKRTKKGV